MFPTHEWIGLAVESAVGWPPEKTVIEFEGQRLVLQPGTRDESPSVIVEFERGVMTHDQAHELLRRYLSALSWTEGHFVRELFRLGGAVGGARIAFGTAPRVRHTAIRFADFVRPIPNDPRAALALAFYREALGALTVPYQVLGFAKTINIINSNGAQQIAWITSMLPHLQNSEALKRMAELHASGTDVGNHVYVSCRCAIAHAFSSPVVNPDSFADDRRLKQDLPLVRELAELVMTRELGLQR